MPFQTASRAAVAALAVLGATLPLAACGSTPTRQTATDAPDLIEGPGVVMTVEGLGCPMCAESIHVLLDNVDGVADSKVNLDDGTVDVAFEPGAAVSRRSLTAAVTDGGFSFRGMRVKE